MKKLVIGILCGASLVLGGCHLVSLDKEGDAWHAKEISLGSESCLAQLACTVSTNGFALTIGEITTGVSSNAIPLVEATGTAVGNVVHTAVTGE